MPRSERACARAVPRDPDATYDGGALVDLAPPSPEVCREVARFLVGVFARQAVADLGLGGEGSADGISDSRRAFGVSPNG